MTLLRKLLRSSSYQMGALFAVLILLGLLFAAHLFFVAFDGSLLRDPATALQRELWLVGGALVLVLLLIFALSYGVTYYVATRFERMAETTERIIRTGNLAERLPVDSSWDDLSKVSALLNSMLEELELRVDGIKAVSDNIAHDLRTPLTRLRASIEEQTDGAVRDQLLGELDDTLAIFRSLLRISAIEAGKQPLALAEVDLRDLLRDATELYEPVLAEKNQPLSVAGDPCLVAADRDLLFQGIVNLIDNASKFTAPGGAIDVHVACRGDTATVTVCDEGPGIPEHRRAQVLERFQRLDDSRSEPGNGLGLPLVAAILRRHGGTLKLKGRNDGQTGLCVEFTLPVSAGVS